MKEKGFKKGLTRRLFSVVLALAMVLSLVPLNTLTVYAQDFTKLQCSEHPGVVHIKLTEKVSAVAWKMDKYNADGTFDRNTNITDAALSNMTTKTVGSWGYKDSDGNYKTCTGSHSEAPFTKLQCSEHPEVEHIKLTEKVSAVAWKMDKYNADGTFNKNTNITDAALSNMTTKTVGSWGYKDSDGNYKTCTGSQSEAPPHTHTWAYSLVGTDTIKAVCSGDNDCTVTNGKTTGVSLTLTASSANYSGKAATITVGSSTEKSAWEGAELTVPTTIVYETAEGAALTSAPTEAGSYVAKVSPVGEEATEANTAKVSFEIIPIAVTGISLDKTSMNLAKNATSALTATVSPANATNKTVTWSTSNENVATVSSTGVVTAVGSGVAVITAECGDFSVECAVTVYANTYTLTVPATAEAAGAGFNAVGNVNVKGNIAGDKKIVVKASGSDNNKFKSTAVSTTVGYTIVKGNASENTEIPETGLVFSQDEVNKETVTEAGTVKGTSVAVGIIVKEADYINADDGDYTTTVTWKASLSSASAE